MKIAYKHLVDRIPSRPSIEDISNKLFQLGHEHEIENKIFDLEITPNRGDCLSVNGILRDLAVFYSIKGIDEIYMNNIPLLDIEFTNNALDACPSITFLKIEIDSNEISDYSDGLKSYFDEMGVNKNNFFTDVSNYISYETGQPTHVYDLNRLGNKLSLEYSRDKATFTSLLKQEIDLTGKNLVFTKDKKIINLAGVMGDLKTSCSQNTISVIVECAYFNPEAIIGKSIKYDIISDAAYKFERGVDPKSHDHVVRRFLKIVEEHAVIKNVELKTFSYEKFITKTLPADVNLVNKIIGIDISMKEYTQHLSRLGFLINNNELQVPSFRSDVSTNNDIAEEVARVIGYNNISVKDLDISCNKTVGSATSKKELIIKSFLIDNGFYEQITNPFVSKQCINSIKVDNPLDTNREFLRTELKGSLISKLLFNERRQHDSIKMFEISDLYTCEDSVNKKRVLGIIASGRVGKNYINFSKKININYLSQLIEKLLPNENVNIDLIPRNELNTKLKNEIVYLEIEIDDIEPLQSFKFKENTLMSISSKKYKPISDFPSSTRDISFSITDYSQQYELELMLLNFTNDLLKYSFVFDYYKNDKNHEIKIGFRFIFQSVHKTITDAEVNETVDDIIKLSTKLDSVSVPGLKK
jgi:phenylalanyl-tRNA synthetase beta chain